MAEEKKSTPAKAVEAVKKDEVKLTFFKRVGKWFREMKSELKKVIWPTSKEVATNSGVAIAMMLASAVVLWGFDELAQLAVRALISLAG